MAIKKIAITGASSAIGCAIFKELAQQHAEAFFLLHYVSSSQRLAEVLEENGGGERGRMVRADFRMAGALQDFIGELKNTDILVNCAALVKTGALPHLPGPEIRDMLSVNIEAFTAICAEVIPGMLVKRSGCIVNISSTAATRGNRGQTVYAGTKGYMEAFTRSLAAEYGAKGIRANCVAPGPINAGSLTELLGYAEDEVKKSIVSKRPGCPEDVAHMTAFLCSEKARFINGKTFGVDGGFLRGI
ncbi:MAG: SDR family oxidoreductase [bacterium]|nr:SDR family oxidoreductase [bacterium]